MSDEVSVESAGLPSGRLPKELFGVCLTYRVDTYPNWEGTKPGKTRTVPKNAKKRQYFLFTKKSSQDKLIKQLTEKCLLDEQSVTVLHGRIEWDEVETLQVTEEAA